MPYLNQVRDALLAERARLFEQLQGISWLQPYPSQANFILCKVQEVRQAPSTCGGGWVGEGMRDVQSVLMCGWVGG